MLVCFCCLVRLSGILCGNTRLFLGVYIEFGLSSFEFMHGVLVSSNMVISKCFF